MTLKPDKPAASKLKRDANKLTVPQCLGETEQVALARVAYDPAARAVGVGRKFIAPVLGEFAIDASYTALTQQIAKVKTGDLSEVERKLVVQADTLDAIFNDMARRAALNASQYLEAMEVYMRLALKAQNQCRATLETLANIKHPPVLIARQANIATGPQQVNNGVTGPASAHAGQDHEISNQPHVPEAARPSASSGGPSLLSQEPTIRMPLQGASGQGLERVQVPRSQRRSPGGRG